MADDFSAHDVTDFLLEDDHCEHRGSSTNSTATNCPSVATTKCPLTATNRISSCCHDILYQDKDGFQGERAQYHSPVYWQRGEEAQYGRFCEEYLDSKPKDSTVKGELCNSFNSLGVDSHSTSSPASPTANSIDLDRHRCTSNRDIPTDEEIADVLQSLGMDTFHHKPSLWLKRMQALVEPPARYVMQLDADVIPCASDASYLEK